MSESLFDGPGAGFDDPLGMLHACHGRIRDRLDTLDRLIGHLSAHGADQPARQAASSILRYFDTSGRHHHADEEEDLFPRLLEADHDERDALRAVIVRLTGEHLSMERAWSALSPHLEAISDGRGASLPADLVRAFRAPYDAHIDVEEKIVFRIARDVLTPAALSGMGEAMALRRGVSRTL